MKPKNRIKIKQWLKKKISFRFHMSVIMMLTFLLGFYCNLILLNSLSIPHPAIRYPVIVLFSYGTFLLLIRLYLKQFFKNESYIDAPDIIDPPSNFPARTEVEDRIPWEGGGGQFSGGGASGEWGEAIPTREPDSFEIGDLVTDDGEAFIFFAIILGGISILFGSSVYLIWHSPEIISEIFLQIILTSGMQRKFKKVQVKDWVGHLFKMSKYPLLLALGLSILFGLGLRKFCPEANSLKDYKAQCWRDSKY